MTNKHWLEEIHRQTDSWEKTNCPMATEIFLWKNDKSDWSGYHECRGHTWEIDNLETVKTNGLTVDRNDIYEQNDKYFVEETRWDIDVEMFIYQNYIYTVSSEHIHDAQTYTCQSITRRPITIDRREK